jgi:hypothetical protein
LVKILPLQAIELTYQIKAAWLLPLAIAKEPWGSFAHHHLEEPTPEEMQALDIGFVSDK